MFGIALRSKSRVLLATVLIASGLAVPLLIASPASAYNQNGHLQVRGTGSTYTMGYPATHGSWSAGATTAIAVPAGGSATYSFKVLNKGTTASQYQLLMTTDATATVRSGTAYGPVVKMGLYDDKYLTPSINPGATLTYFVKVQLAPNSPQATYNTGILLFQQEATNPSWPTEAMDFVGLKTEVRAPAAGTKPIEIFARNGGLSYVGGSIDGQTAGAAPMKLGAATTFTVRLRNNGPSPSKVGAYIGNEAGCDDGFTLTVKSGATDVTAAWKNYTFQSPTLAKGQTRDYTVTIKRAGSDEFCRQMPRFFVQSDVRVYLGVAPAV